MSPSATILLTSASLLRRPGRVLAVGIALGFAGSLLLVSLLSYQNTAERAAQMPGELLSANQLYLVATDPVQPFVPARIVDQISVDDRVARVDQAIRVPVFDLPADEHGELDGDAFYDGPLAGWIPGKRHDLVAWQEDVPRGKLLSGRWPSDKPDQLVEIVVPQHLMWSMKLGDRRRLESDAGVFLAVVVGFLGHGKSFLGTDESLRLNSWHVTIAAAKRIAGGRRPISDLRIQLADPGDHNAFVKQWRERIAAHPGRLELWDRQVISQRARSGMTIYVARSTVLTLVVLSAASAMCIAFGVQGNAVRRRVAEHDLLRSLGARQVTIFGSLLLESCVLGLIGLVFAVAMGWLIVTVVPVFGDAGVWDPWSLVVLTAVLLFSAATGAAIPAWAASKNRSAGTYRVGRDRSGETQSSWRSALICLAILMAGAACIAATPSNSESRAQAFIWCGVPTLALATLAGTPVVVGLVTRRLTRPVAWLTRTDSLLLADQLSIDRTGSVGSVIATSVGLSGFIWISCWAASMLEPFVVDTSFPRWMVSIYPYGLVRSEVEQVMKQPEFAQMEPLILVDTNLAADTGDAAEILATSESSTVTESPTVRKTTATLVVGVRPAFAGQRLPIEVLQGDRQTILSQLSDGPHCLVSSWYAVSVGLQVGDKLAVAVPGQLAERVYRIAGIVNLRGWLMSTKQNKVRLRGRPHELMIICDIARVREDFQTAHANYFLGDTASGLASEIPSYPQGVSLRRGTSLSRQGREAMSDVVQRVVDLDQPLRHAPDGFDVTLMQRSVQTDDLDRVRAALRGEWGATIARRLGWLPLIFLGFSLFSVAGSLITSVGSRGRELGILRSCGFTRFALTRMLFAESLLIGLSAVVVACLFGFGGAWIGLQVAQIAGLHWRWAGIGAEFLIPWSWLWPGWWLTFGVCAAASLIAGWRIGRISPAQLFRDNASTT
ncbi:MAG: ABC transporter permease [Planctomycetota bacterium]